MPTAVQWGMLRKSPRCTEMGMLRQSPHCSAGWGCYEIVPTAVQEVVKVTVKPSVKNETTPGEGAADPTVHTRVKVGEKGSAMRFAQLRRNTHAAKHLRHRQQRQRQRWMRRQMQR